jgi:ribosomal protein S12 methylthiotransferase accessory factor
MEIPVKMAGGRAVEATVGEHSVRADQPIDSGGEGTAPSSSELFLASIAMCAGYYILNFCLERKIPADDIGVLMTTHKNDQTKLLDRIELKITLPPEFPEKYEKAVVRAAELCWVKKNIQKAPAFETYAVR